MRIRYFGFIALCLGWASSAQAAVYTQTIKVDEGDLAKWIFSGVPTVPGDGKSVACSTPLNSCSQAKTSTATIKFEPFDKSLGTLNSVNVVMKSSITGIFILRGDNIANPKGTFTTTMRLLNNNKFFPAPPETLITSNQAKSTFSNGVTTNSTAKGNSLSTAGSVLITEDLNLFQQRIFRFSPLLQVSIANNITCIDFGCGATNRINKFSGIATAYYNYTPTPPPPPPPPPVAPVPLPASALLLLASLGVLRAARHR